MEKKNSSNKGTIFKISFSKTNKKFTKFKRKSNYAIKITSGFIKMEK